MLLLLDQRPLCAEKNLNKNPKIKINSGRCTGDKLVFPLRETKRHKQLVCYTSSILSFLNHNAPFCGWHVLLSKIEDPAATPHDNLTQLFFHDLR